MRGDDEYGSHATSASLLYAPLPSSADPTPAQVFLRPTMSFKSRRRTLHIFRPSSPHGADTGKDKFEGGKKKNRPYSASISSSITETRASPPLDSAISEKVELGESPKIRPRTLLRSNRNSMFGSLRTPRSLEDGEGLTKTDSRDSLYEALGALLNVGDLFGHTVLHHGEVQIAGGMFRKKVQHLVLTETHLIRFRSQGKAAEAFPSIPSPTVSVRATTNRAASVVSFQDLYTDITVGIPLDQIIAAFKLDDGKPYFTIEISYLDERSRRATSMQVQLSEPREAEAWLHEVRNASSRIRAKSALEPVTASREYVAQVLERERDYDPQHFQMFPVVQRASQRATGRSSSDDLSKVGSTICYLAIGLYKIHLVPLARSSGRSSTSSLVDLDAPLSYGIMTLTSLALQAEEDTFQLIFRTPARNQLALQLASSAASEIVLSIKYAAEYLRPEWMQQPFVFDVPAWLDEQQNPPTFPEEDHKCFDRTLVAYCSAYEVDTSRIRYTVDHDCEDAPCFRLLPPIFSNYVALELLAVTRALRYNESFASISFANVRLNALRYLYDPFGFDIDCLYTRSGTSTKIPVDEGLSVLLQEIRALGLKSKRLRRMDFTNSILRPSSSSNEADQSCGIPEALVPLCKRSLTNVDWIVLNGIKLGSADLDYLVDAASERTCHLRAIEIGDSGLAVHDLDVLLSTLADQENTLEVIDISGALGRFSPELFQRQIGYFGHIRRLNLTRIQKTAGPGLLIPPETLMAWRLEALYLSQTSMNEQTVDALSTYLHSPMSETLRELHVDQSGVTGADIAVCFHSMTREPGKGRRLHLSASENRLRQGYVQLFNSIRQNHGPTRFTARMIEFERERHFRELVEALTKNTTLEALDISKASLPYDATDETCEALKTMFAQNSSLVELDISGEHAHLDSARFGIGLNLALTGLKKNKTLKRLRIEHQSLGLQGANTLAEVLEQNDALEEIHCENNDLNLQSFTVLVNALQKNRSILYMPPLDRDREQSLEKLQREIKMADNKTNGESLPRRSGGLIRTLTGGKGSKHRLSLRHATAPPTNSYAPQDVAAALLALNEKWDAQLARMQTYLQRNYHLANGLPWDEAAEKEVADRPATADSIGRLWEKIALEMTPTAEKEVESGLELDVRPREIKPEAPFSLSAH